MTRLAKALNSSDLSHQEADCDVDVLQSAGLAAITRNLGVVILEAKQGAAGDGPHAVARIKDLEQALAPRVKRLARRWRLRVDVEKVAKKVALELIVDRCLVCHGRGFIPMRYDGQRMVAVTEDWEDTAKDVDCHVCFGSGAGRRDFDGRARSAGLEKYTRQLADWWEAVLQSCCDAELSAQRAIWRKLKTNNYP